MNPDRNFSSKGKTMTTLRKQLLIGVTAFGLGLGSLAVASPGEHMSGGRHGDHRIERMKEHMEKRATELRAKLNLNAEQQKAWDVYIAAMKPARGERPARLSRDEMAKLSAPERMERMHRMMQQREQGMAARVAATRDLYAVLTPEQRKVFDENFHLGRGHHSKGKRDKS
jgi:protein CpxP